MSKSCKDNWEPGLNNRPKFNRLLKKARAKTTRLRMVTRAGKELFFDTTPEVIGRLVTEMLLIPVSPGEPTPVEDLSDKQAVREFIRLELLKRMARPRDESADDELGDEELGDEE